MATPEAHQDAGWGVVADVTRLLSSGQDARAILGGALDALARVAGAREAVILLPATDLRWLHRHGDHVGHVQLGPRAATVHGGPLETRVRALCEHGRHAEVLRARGILVWPELDLVLLDPASGPAQRPSLTALAHLVRAVILGPLHLQHVEEEREENAAKLAELQLQTRLLRNLSVVDEQTQLFNRRYFDEHLRYALGRHRRYGEHVALLVLDVDHFKSINDERGHFAGDCALRALAWTVMATVRNLDTVARIGGEEFAVILPQTTMHDAATAAERVRIAIEGMVVHTPQGSFQITVSIGIAATHPGWSGDAERMFRTADAALYAAKHGGRNQVATAPSGQEL